MALAFPHTAGAEQKQSEVMLVLEDESYLGFFS
jgi:hypothetical protein